MIDFIKSYLGLCKLKVVALIVFTAMVGMFLATAPPGMVPLDVLLFGNLGIGMAASAAAAINHVLDAREDAKMTRTSGRPLPQGEIIQRLLAAIGIEVEIRALPTGLAMAAGTLCEYSWRFLPLAGEPPVTRFAVEQLGTAHWFDTSAAEKDFGYRPRVSIEEGLAALKLNGL